MEQQIREWLRQAASTGASDLHIVAGYPPTLRLHGQLRALPVPALTEQAARETLEAICPPDVLEKLRTERNADFAWQLPMDNRQQRFRVNYFFSGGSLGGCFRVIAAEIPDFTWSGFPRELAHRLAHFLNGLVLFSGVTGAGKTTTLAMIINLLNQEGGHRIITVEEPIEYLFPATANSIVTQREVGHDVESFADGLKFGLRQDPDVILVGEIRDRDTAQMALSAAETGHLVFSTLHTRDAKGAISRFVDLFPQTAQTDVRSQLSLSLRAVISQHLLPSVDPDGKRELALEILFNNAPVASAIRFGKVESIDTSIQIGRADGMVMLDESIKQLFLAGRISRDTAERFISNRELLKR